MRYRELGRTGLEVSEIGFGAEWMEKKSAAEVRAVVERCEEAGINILDCWMAGPEVRSNLGAALAGTRDRWIIQGHIGSTWQDGQYVRTRDMDLVRPAFEAALLKLYPREYWGPINHQWVLFGRETCIARNPKCATCFLCDLCPSCGKA